MKVDITKHYGDYTDAELEKMSIKQLIKIIKHEQANDNFIIMSDSYKMTHHLLLPDGITEAYSYLTSRGGEMPYTVFFGLQYYLRKYVAGVRITPDKIEEARQMNIAHFGFDCFDDAMWYHIWNKHGGVLPLEIKAIPEGTAIKTKNILMDIINTDDKTAALTNITETLLLKLWATNTVGAYDRILKTLIKKYWKLTSDVPEFLIDYMHHDFGYRGVSSEETARLLGCAALTQFKGTDTMGALKLAKDYYNESMAGFSVIASEHSVHCSYGKRDKEAEGYAKIIEKVKKKCWNVNPASGIIILSLVSDTYNIYNVSKRILPFLKDAFIGWKNKHGCTIKIVLRPDSGNPQKVLFGINDIDFSVEDYELAQRCAVDMNISIEDAIVLIKKGIFEILFDEFGYTINSKGYKVLHSQIGVLQGDGVSYKVISDIYKIMVSKKIDIMNLVFGSGGKHLQAHDRDEQKYATKVIHVIINGKGISVQKKPITDLGKESKCGYLKLKRTGPTWKDYITLQSDDEGYDECENVLNRVFLNGEILIEYDLSEVRKNGEILEIEFSEEFENNI